MNKYSLDLYQCKNNYMENNLQDSLHIYSIAQKTADLLGVELIFKPTIIPYFYGKNPKDNGVSCFCYFKENNNIGLFTMHTFSTRKAVYFDLLSKTEFDFDSIKNILCNLFNPNKVCSGIPFKENTWGVELTAFGKANTNANEMYDLCQNIIKDINMTQIANTIIEKNQSQIVIITLIAESHIAIFYDTKNNKVFLDIFSCKNYNYEVVLKILKNFKINITSYSQSSRGIYHEQII